MFDFKIFRKENNMTQKSAAEYFGCTQAFISGIETGKEKIPDAFISKIKADEGFKEKGFIFEKEEMERVCPKCSEKDIEIRVLKEQIKELRAEMYERLIYEHEIHLGKKDKAV